MLYHVDIFKVKICNDIFHFNNFHIYDIYSPTVYLIVLEINIILNIKNNSDNSNRAVTLHLYKSYDLELFIYLGFYVAFKTVQVMSQRVGLWAEVTIYIQLVNFLYCKLPTFPH